MSNEFTEDRREAYLAELRSHGEKALARHNIQVSRQTIYTHKKRDSAFAEAESEAMAYYIAQLGKEFHRRGVEGVERILYHKGEECGREVEYSDKLLIKHAERHSEEYRQGPKTQVNVNNIPAGAAALAEILRELDDEDREAVEKVLLKAIEKKKAASQEERGEND